MTSQKPNDSDKASGRIMAELRKEAGLTQEQVAVELGISARALSKNELGQTKVAKSRFEEVLRIVRRHKLATGGFAESQAVYDGQVRLKTR